jgi:hypothetical protein
LFINDLGLELKELNCGIKCGEDVINILLYADDLVIMAENETVLQKMIDKCGEWCMQWRLNVNISKTKVVHFRTSNFPRTNFVFKYFQDQIIVDVKYTYLGMLLDEHLNFKSTANVLADSCSRAFGFVASKFKNFKILDYHIFSKIFRTCLSPIMDYSSGVWGYKQFEHVRSIENKIIRYFLGVHRFTPNLGIWGDMGWMPAEIRRKLNMVRLWCKLVRSDDFRLVKRVFLTDLQNCKHYNFKNWTWEVKRYSMKQINFTYMI